MQVALFINCGGMMVAYLVVVRDLVHSAFVQTSRVLGGVVAGAVGGVNGQPDVWSLFPHHHQQQRLYTRIQHSPVNTSPVNTSLVNTSPVNTSLVNTSLVNTTLWGSVGLPTPLWSVENAVLLMIVVGILGPLVAFRCVCVFGCT